MARDKRSVKILVVDDTEEVREGIVMMLEKIGYYRENIAVASDGSQALMMILSGMKADMIVTDLDMPNLNGDELRKQLAARNNPTPVIMVTGKDPQSRPHAENNLKAVLDKPFSSMELDTALDMALASVENPPTRF